jgi:carboxypeptidase T
MKQTKTGLVILIVMLFSMPLFSIAQKKAPYKIMKVKIHPPADRYKTAELLGLLDIDHFYTDQDGGIISEINEMELAKLKTTPYSYEILTPDIQKELDSLNKIYFASLKNQDKSRVAIEQPGKDSWGIIKTPPAFLPLPTTYGGYLSYAEMVTAMDNLVTAYPGLVTKTSIGKSTENRDIWVIKISDNAAIDELNEPEVLMMGLQHCREAIGGSSMIFLMEYLCDQYSKDQRIKDLVDNREIYIIPCFNPDGWEWNRTAYGGDVPGGDWRKNRRPNGGSSYGVDLNRNWGVDWGNCSAPISGPSSSCGSNTTTLDTYYGPGAFSEPETQAVRAFTKAHHLVVGFDQHSYGPYYSLPFGRKELHPSGLGQKNTDFYTAVPALMGMYNGMRAADSYDALGYEVAGGFKDWMLMGELGVGTKDSVWAMTGEGSAGGGLVNTNTTNLGTRNFWAPASQIEQLCKSMCYQNLQLIYAAGSYVDIQDASDIALTSLTGNAASYRVRRLGLGNSPVTVTMVPIENIKTVGAPVTIPGMAYYEVVNGTIPFTLYPTMTNGQRIKFAWKITTAGYTYSDTVVKFLNPSVAFSDDMETAANFATNWTATTTGASSTEKWSYTTLQANGGTHSLTESVSGNYTGNSTRTVTYRSTFNLGGKTAAYLRFWTKHRLENSSDKVQVQVSTNGSTWVPIAGSTTIQEPGVLDGSTLNGQPALTGIRDYWTPETFDLSAYLGQTTLSLRFVFTSDAGTGTFIYDNDDGIYIDDIKVITSNAALQLLPVNFTSFTGTLMPNNTVRLNWEAEIDHNFDHFEVEHSADGNNFNSLGNGPAQAPFAFIDQHPYWGNNYYRIKSVDKNGNVTFSKIITIFVGPRSLVNIFPNPVANLLFVKLNNRGADEFKVQIADVQGRVVYSKNNIVNQDAAELKIEMKQLKPQTYILKITNSKGEVVATEKIIKY